MSDIISDIYFDKNRGYYVEVFDDKSKPLFVVCIDKDSKLEEVLPADSKIDSSSSTIKDLAEFNGVKTRPIENQYNIIYQVMDIDEVKLKNLVTVSNGVCKFNLFGVKHFVDLEDYVEKDYTEVIPNEESHYFTSPSTKTNNKKEPDKKSGSSYTKPEPTKPRKSGSSYTKPEPTKPKKSGSSNVRKSSSFN